MWRSQHYFHHISSTSWSRSLWTTVAALGHSSHFYFERVFTFNLLLLLAWFPNTWQIKQYAWFVLNFMYVCIMYYLFIHSLKWVEGTMFWNIHFVINRMELHFLSTNSLLAISKWQWEFVHWKFTANELAEDHTRHKRLWIRLIEHFTKWDDYFKDQFTHLTVYWSNYLQARHSHSEHFN